MSIIHGFSDELKYPRLSVLICFITDLLIVAGVSLSTRLLHQFIRLLSRYLPIDESQTDVGSYLPLSVTRSLVTFSDTVAILAMFIISVITLWRIATLSVKQVRGGK